MTLLQERRRLSSLFFAAFMVPVGVVIHVSAEFVGLGLLELSSTMLARHLYLLIVGVLALVALARLAGACASPLERRRRLTALLAHLPLGGRGHRFSALCFSIQGLLFIASQALEGCPIAGGDFLAAAFAALMLCVVAALFIATLPKQVVRIFAECYLTRACEYGVDRRRLTPRRFFTAIAAPICDSYQAVIGNRPPPLLATSL